MNRPQCSTAECDSHPAPGCMVGACVARDHWWCSRARMGRGRNSRRSHVLSNICQDPSCDERAPRMQFGNIKDVRFYPMFNSGHFWAALSMISGFYPTRNFGHFWAPSLVTLLIFRNVMTREHLNTQNTPGTHPAGTHPAGTHPAGTHPDTRNTKTPKHLNT